MRRLMSLAIGAAAVIALPNIAAAEGGARYNWGSPHAPGTPSAGGWHARGNWNGHSAQHVRIRRGHVLPRFWMQPSFFVPNWGHYGFPAPGLGRNWVRYHGDALLVDRAGYVHDHRYDVDWERYDHGPVPAYAPGPEDDLFYEDEAVTWGGGRSVARYRAAYPEAAPHFEPAPYAMHPTQPYTLPYPAAGESRVYHVPPGATVTITAPMATTTTTREYVEDTPRRRSKARRR